MPPKYPSFSHDQVAAECQLYCGQKAKKYTGANHFALVFIYVPNTGHFFCPVQSIKLNYP